jgi:hypothetical protein
MTACTTVPACTRLKGMNALTVVHARVYYVTPRWYAGTRRRRIPAGRLRRGERGGAA